MIQALNHELVDIILGKSRPILKIIFARISGNLNVSSLEQISGNEKDRALPSYLTSYWKLKGLRLRCCRSRFRPISSQILCLSLKVRHLKSPGCAAPSKTLIDSWKGQYDKPWQAPHPRPVNALNTWPHRRITKLLNNLNSDIILRAMKHARHGKRMTALDAWHKITH